MADAIVVNIDGAVTAGHLSQAMQANLALYYALVSWLDHVGAIDRRQFGESLKAMVRDEDGEITRAIINGAREALISEGARPTFTIIEGGKLKEP